MRAPPRQRRGGGPGGFTPFRGVRELLERGQDISSIKESLVHKDVSTTIIYIYVFNRGPRDCADQLILLSFATRWFSVLYMAGDVEYI